MLIIAKHIMQITVWQCEAMGAEKDKICEASSAHLYQTFLPRPQSMPFELQVLLLWMKTCTARHAVKNPARINNAHHQYVFADSSVIQILLQDITCNVLAVQLQVCTASYSTALCK